MTSPDYAIWTKLKHAPAESSRSDKQCLIDFSQQNRSDPSLAPSLAEIYFRVCDFLYGEQRYWGFKDIYEALGIERYDEVEGAEVKDYLVHGILIHLRLDRNVKVPGRGRHQITEKGIKTIEGV